MTPTPHPTIERRSKPRNSTVLAEEHIALRQRVGLRITRAAFELTRLLQDGEVPASPELREIRDELALAEREVWTGHKIHGEYFEALSNELEELRRHN